MADQKNPSMFSFELVFDDLRLFQTDLTPVMKRFYSHMVRQTDLMFENAGGPGSGSAGGSYRGVDWAPFGLQYTRSDGIEVPIWGGIPRLDGNGMVQPRLRPSGQPYSPSSMLMQDTNTLRQHAATEVADFSPASMVMGTRKEYAAEQNELRPFLFFTEDDADMLQTLVGEHLLMEDENEQ